MNHQNKELEAKNQRIKGYIMPLLEWNEDQYMTFKMRCGRNFMQSYMPQYPELIDEVIESRLFWAWWMNQWLIRDEALLMQENFLESTVAERLLYYRWLHFPDNLLRVLVVDSIIFENTSITQKPVL